MLLHISDLVKKFDAKEVLNIPQFSVAQGELVGILGNNGAGKTTLFRLCLDLLKADTGSIFIENEVVNKTDSWKTFTSAYIDEGFLIDFLTPEEYFYFTGDLYEIDKMQINSVLNDFIPFTEDEILNKKKCIEKFSKGNKQKIGIISAMLTRPRLLILDEPFNFLDPSSQIMMKQLLLDYNQKYSTTILLSSHNLQHVMDVCSRVILLESGHIIRDNTSINDINRNEIKQYFENKA